MQFNWKDYFDLANSIIDESFLKSSPHLKEAIYRNYISRSYYYIYNKSLNVAQKLGYKIETSDKSSHKSLQLFFKSIKDRNNSEDFELETLIDILIKLSENRKKADYDNVFKISDNLIKTTKNNVNDAESILDKIEQYINKEVS
ncbi:MAG: hypothetical protein U0457_16260 [Candidatus Sericytochromatia bacterium]